MRVVHVRSPYLNLSETFIDRLVRSHVAAEPTVVTVDPRQYTEGLHVAAMPPGLGRWADRLGRVAVRPPLALAPALARVRPALVHAHFGPDAVRALPAARRAGVPLVASFYGFDVTRSPRHVFWRRAYARLAAHAAHVTAVSDKMARDLIGLGFDPARLSVVRMGLDVAAFPFVARTAVPAAPRLLMVGRMVEKKGYAVALDALAALRRGETDATLRLVGDGPLRASLEARAAALGLGDAVAFDGSASVETVCAHLAEHDVLLVPSVRAANGDEEGLPNTVVEGLARGIPVVGTRHAGIPEAIRDGDTGLLVDEHDADALAAAVLRYVDTPDLVAGVSQRGRVLVEQAYTIAAMVDAVEAIYASVSASAPVPRGTARV